MNLLVSQHAQTWRAVLSQRVPPRPERGLERVWLACEGLLARARRRPGKYLALAAAAAGRAAGFAALDEALMRERGERLRQASRTGENGREHLIESMAFIRERARRELRMEPYPVQVAGAAALLDGCIIEMATGEGKTLVAAMAAVVAGWRGRGCHIVTVNDYLVQRDAEWMRPLYRSCGVSAGFVTDRSDAEARRRAYRADVTYATNKEVAADFLRDRIVLQRLPDLSRVVLDAVGDRDSDAAGALLQRGLEFAIVDEADSILIDEAVTPLIIAAPAANPQAAEAVVQARDLAEPLREGRDYRIDRRFKEISLTDRGWLEVQKRAEGLGGIWKGARRAEELVVQALVARELYMRDKNYVLMSGKVVIVDEFTGRLMPDRTWRGGLHEAVEAKEGHEIRAMNDTVARVSFQSFFRSYRMLSGMTGTAREARGELWSTYRTPVVPIPTNRPSRRERRPTRFHVTEAERWSAVLDEIESVHANGQPVLAGTRTVNASERLSAMLRERGIEHQVLNAVKHDREAEVIARAGEPGTVTIATNMAGRGTDIRLGSGVADRGGLHVIVTEAHESRRIDRQLLGRAARQGDPGSGRLHVSLEDELILRHASFTGRSLRILGNPRWFAAALLRLAQARAQRLARRQRSGLARTDEWLEKGLAFTGRSRH